MPQQFKEEEIVAELRKLDDRQLVSKILDGDTQAAGYYLSLICYKYFFFIKNQRLTKLDIRAEDLISDFYLFLEDNDWKKLRTFRFESKLETWVNTVASRYLTKKYAKELKENPVLNPPIDEGYLQHMKPSESNMSSFELNEAINQLPNRRERMVLFYTLEGYKADEIAEKMEISENNVYIIKHKAIKHLRDLLLNDK